MFVMLGMIAGLVVVVIEPRIHQTSNVVFFVVQNVFAATANISQARGQVFSPAQRFQFHIFMYHQLFAQYAT